MTSDLFAYTWPIFWGQTDESGADSDIEDDTTSLPSSVNEKRSVSSPEPEVDDFGKFIGFMFKIEKIRLYTLDIFQVFNEENVIFS